MPLWYRALERLERYSVGFFCASIQTDRTVPTLIKSFHPQTASRSRVKHGCLKQPLSYVFQNKVLTKPYKGVG